MRIFSYRNKRNLRRAGIIALCVLVLLLILFWGRVVYLDRFVVYEGGSAHLDYSQSLSPTGQPPQRLDPAEYPFETDLTQSDAAEAAQTTLSSISGYYISTTMLAQDVDAVRAALDELDDYSAVMLDVKSIFGNYYYSTQLSGASQATVDIDAIDDLIQDLAAQKNLYLIARVPTFSDPEYALAHQSEGLPLSSGALWTDEYGCYWLNPYSSDVQGYLSSIAIELSGLGFDEVLFDNFYFPDTDRIMWNSEITRDDAILDAAKTIKDNLVGINIRVSYGTDVPAVAAFADRAYIAQTDASGVDTLIEAFASVQADTSAQIVFLTDSRDTRFETCSVLRPLLDETTE